MLSYIGVKFHCFKLFEFRAEIQIDVKKDSEIFKKEVCKTRFNYFMFLIYVKNVNNLTISECKLLRCNKISILFIKECV